jgi:hypothetical protein
VVFRLRFRKEKTNQTGKMMAAYQSVDVDDEADDFSGRLDRGGRRHSGDSLRVDGFDEEAAFFVAKRVALS